MNIEIRKCVTEDEIGTTYTIMSQLRPHVSVEKYVSLIKSLGETDNYELLGAYSDGICIGVAGIRYRRSLFRNGESELYVDDLVTDERFRSHGVGHQIMDCLMIICKQKNCVGIVLDSGLKREDSHRFYKREGMEVTALHFFRPKVQELSEEELRQKDLEKCNNSQEVGIIK